ncbi:hypothetical protein EC968_001065 [Mortierella alpina]|nr:hypothetical protein EC968_001065 [Mortierella alpina]
MWFDSYRVNMRESLQREVEDNIQKAKVLKEAMKESSDQDAEVLMSEEQAEYNKSKLGHTTPTNRSNTSLNRQQQQQQQQQQGQQQQQNGSSMFLQGKQNSSSATNVMQEKRSPLDRIFGRKASVNSHASTVRNQVTPHPQPQRTPSPSLQPSSTSNTLNVPTSNGPNNASAVDLSELKYLPVEEESEEEEILDRSMSVPGSGVGRGGAVDGQPMTGTEVKLHPTRAKTFALPKSLKNLKRRIAALRAKGTDLDAEQRERDERERRRNGGVAGGMGDEKKKFTLIRLLPWKSSKKTVPTTTVTATTEVLSSPSRTA